MRRLNISKQRRRSAVRIVRTPRLKDLAGCRSSGCSHGSRRESDWSKDATSTTLTQIQGDQDIYGSRGFTGHEHLDHTGIIHMNGRIYDPRLGRFLQPDPIVQSPRFSQSYNRYAYVFNSPLSLTNPIGFRSCGDGHGLCREFEDNGGIGSGAAPASGRSGSGRSGGGSGVPDNYGGATETFIATARRLHGFRRVSVGLERPTGSAFGSGTRGGSGNGAEQPALDSAGRQQAFNTALTGVRSQIGDQSVKFTNRFAIGKLDPKGNVVDGSIKVFGTEQEARDAAAARPGFTLLNGVTTLGMFGS